MLNCIATPRTSNRCTEASRSFEDGVSQLSIREQQGQAIQRARELIDNARERQKLEILKRLQVRREQILREIEDTDRQIEKKINKMKLLENELENSSQKFEHKQLE